MIKGLFNLLLVASLFISPSHVVAENIFPDVSIDNLNAKSIEFLKGEEVIKGFSDGTFGPDRNITRCEFLKIAIEASNITVEDTSKTIFPDLDPTFWCNNYANEAKTLGAIKGDDTGLFWPERNISRIEALKILFALRQEVIDPQTSTASSYFDVPKDSWYAPYVISASKKNIIAGQKPLLFGSNDSLKRGEMAEMIYRLVAIKANEATTYNDTLTIEKGYLKNQKAPVVVKSTVDSIELPQLMSVEDAPSTLSGTINKTFYEQITLDNDIPRTFVINEVYTISGKVEKKTKSVTIFLSEKNSEKQYTFTGIVNTADSTFSVPVDFNIGGQFAIGIILGATGSSNVKDIVVVSEKTPPKKTLSDFAKNLTATINEDGDSVFKWDNGTAKLSKIVFQQSDKLVTKIISINGNTWIPDYKLFKDFKPGLVYWTVFLANSSTNGAYNISSDWTSSETKGITVVTHNFVSYEKNDLILDTLSIKSDIGKTIKFEGTSNVDMRKEATIIRPDGFTVDYNVTTSQKESTSVLNQAMYKAPVEFKFFFPAKIEGVYFVEINASNGLALYNSPLYVGNIIPLLPDFRDLEKDLEPITQSQIINNLKKLRTDLLAMINNDRRRLKLSPVVLDDDLNMFANAHSDDLSKNNYFSHINMNGEGPGERKAAFNIKTPVGENLAKARNLISIHQGLMRSAIHRANVLRTYWERVGIGFSMDKEGNVLAVEEFSTKPLQESDLSSIKNDLYSYINKERQKLEMDTFVTNSLAEDIVTNWSKEMANDDFFNFDNPNTNDSLQKNIQDAGFNKSFSTVILSGSDLDSLITNLLTNKNSSNQPIYSDERWKQLAVGLSLSEDSVEILATVVFIET